MASLSTKFQSFKQDWETPEDLFHALDDEFHFTLDAAANADNSKCSKFLSQEQNALKADWGKQVCWLNPPYGGSRESSLENWIKKARLEADRGSVVVCLIPARTNTNWFHEICLSRCEVRFVKGRPKFNGATHGLPQPLSIVVMRPPDSNISFAQAIAVQ